MADAGRAETASATGTTARDLMTLQRVGEGRFRSEHFAENPLDFVFGGQPIGQALAAAIRTAPGARPRSGAGYFIGRGVIGEPIDYDVETLRDGRDLAVRRVRAAQGARVIFEALCALERASARPDHAQASIVHDSSPDTLPTLKEFVSANRTRMSDDALRIYLHPFAVDLKLVEPERVLFHDEPQRSRRYWMRMPSATAIDDPAEHACLIAFMSDYWFASVVGSANGRWARGGAMMLTANHSLWFHGPARADEWLFFQTEVRSSSPVSGLVAGSLYSRAGELIATAAQEVIFRERRQA